MSLLTDHPSVRWAAPVAAACLIGGGVVASRMTASADTELPTRTAAQLLNDVQSASVPGVSGTVVASADLGLPALPGPAGRGSSELSSLISGTHTMRVWAAGSDRTRLALLGSNGESDVVRNGNDVWLWSSQQKKATHLRLPAGSAAAHHESVPATPQETSRRILDTLQPSTTVSVDGTTSVAGRAAYELVLEPKQSGSLVKDVRVAIDGKTHVPLRVQVHSTRISKPAIEVGFTSVDFGRPDAGQFTFNPPPGTDVTTKTVAPQKNSAGMMNDVAGLLKATKPNVIGSGWTSVLTARVPEQMPGQKSGENGPSVDQLVGMLPRVQGAWGSGHQLQGTLFTALVTDDGRLLVGAVPPQTLYAAAAR
ncbi:LolA-like protein [Luteipulveratus flavus]|uniref:Outer membrane lipoprotein-sorting protein n=1 Tax=Luteipulveratus flavus TaxID=3031728 RepID=A0ABT6C2Q1_9MICO|nr:hypothetical protein [Luteipulveratus sp. YIM 133296]MDF8262930.1 hypothetical protein [Luteipulveratus sp. YIM 133296]